jgi:hypothetical protein
VPQPDKALKRRIGQAPRRNRFRLDPVFWRILAEPQEDWLRALIREPGRVFVRRAPRFAFDARIHERFDAARRQEPDLTVEERKFFQRNGEPSFSVLRFRAVAQPKQRSTASSGASRSRKDRSA